MGRKAFGFSSTQTSRKGGRREVPLGAWSRLLISCDPFQLRHSNEGSLTAPCAYQQNPQDFCSVLASEVGSLAVALIPKTTQLAE